MARVLLIDDDLTTLNTFASILRLAGHEVVEADCGAAGLHHLGEPVTLDVAFVDLNLPDRSGLDILREAQNRRWPVKLILITGFGGIDDAVEAMRLGAIDVIEKPLFESDLLAAIECALAGAPHRVERRAHGNESEPEPHAAMRWARALVPLIDSPVDPRTITLWSRWVAASCGTIRNWCLTAGIQPRRSLLFGRLLRAAALNIRAAGKPQNLLDVADRRTLRNILREAGFHGDEQFPVGTAEFLARQKLIQDADALTAVARALMARERRALED
jgi:ActR/RegA family two-component response regulator